MCRQRTPSRPARGRLLVAQLQRLLQPAHRAPGRQPAVAQPTRTPHRRVGATPHEQGDRRVGSRSDDGVHDVEVFAVEGHRLAGQERPEDGEGLVAAPAPGARVDTADLDLVAVLAADADAEDEPARRQLAEGRDGAGDRQRVTQRQQVDSDVQLEGRMQLRERGHEHQRLHAGAAPERDVVRVEHAVQAGVCDRLEHAPPLRQIGRPEAVRGTDRDRDHDRAAAVTT